MGLYCQPLLGARGSTLTDVTVYNDVVVKSRMKFVWSILQFCSTKPTDSGQYTCIADNEFIHNRTTFQLTHSWFVVPRITKGCATIHSLRCYDMYAMSPQSPQTSWSCVVDQKHTGISREHNPPDLHRWHHVDASRPNCLLGVYKRWCSTPTINWFKVKDGCLLEVALNRRFQIAEVMVLGFQAHILQLLRSTLILAELDDDNRNYTSTPAWHPMKLTQPSSTRPTSSPSQEVRCFRTQNYRPLSFTDPPILYSLPRLLH